MTKTPYTFDRVVRLLIGLGILILLFLTIQRLSNVLLPFFIAWLLAYLLEPLVQFFQFRLKFKNRILSIACTLFVFFGTIIGVIWFLTPIITNEILKLSELVIFYSQELNVNNYLPIAWQNEIQRYLSHLNLQTILHDDNLMSGVKNLTPHLWNFINSSLNFIIGLAVVFVIFLYLVFLLLDFETFNTNWLHIVPSKYRTILSEITFDMKTGMNRYFRGQALISLIVGILFAIGFSIIQLPLAIIMGLLIGLFTMVPYLKSILVLPCIVLGFLQSVESEKPFLSIMLGIVIIFIIIQTIEDLLITPKIMGKVTGLNPAVILLSLSIWGSLMGVVGMIIALPMTTLIISYYKRFVLKEFQDSNIETTDKETNKTPPQLK